MALSVEVQPVSPARWDDLAALFARPGPRGGTPMTAGCWCMWWRQRTGDPGRNEEAMGALVRSGAEPGLLGYVDGIPAGWVSVAPRESYGQLVRSRTYGPRDGDTGVWSVACFYVAPGYKRLGLATTLAAGAVSFARSRGAAAVEAYPHARAADDYMGSVALFEALGFVPVRPAGARVLVRLDL